jgi:murein DD-endopeptidase MepM/ murein hydrolase activator NlpD
VTRPPEVAGRAASHALRCALAAGLLWLMPLPSPAVAAGGIAGWQEFERRVRDGELGLAEGRAAIARWAEVLEAGFPADDFGRQVFFPVKGYGLGSIGGRNGEGYRPAGYEFLGGNRHKGHPAQDIFIADRDQDGMDDRTGRPAEVLALADGVVLSSFTQWEPDEERRHIRGGNYLWIYHPGLKAVSYYAHLQALRVAPGDRVPGGAAVATLGRTGANAYPARSPTHLHVMLLRAGDMTPVDPFPFWKQGAGPLKK